VRRDGADVIEAVITKGDLARLTPQEKTKYYAEVCRSVGLNPFTRPFEYISLSGKLTLYARREATDQLRRLNGISLEVISRDVTEGILTVHVRAKDKSGRTDEDFGAVSIKGLAGTDLANATMRAITKGKRRVTLSISGLGFLDESEVEDIAPHERAAPADTRAQLDHFAGIAHAPGDDAFDPETGEVFLNGEALEAYASECAARGTEALREMFRGMTHAQRDAIGALIGNPKDPGQLLRLAQDADSAAAAAATEPPAGIPSAAAPLMAAAVAPAGDRAADPVWLAEFAAMTPRPSDLADDSPDWTTYAEAVRYLISRATAADLAAVEVSKNLHLRRMREEQPETYRGVTKALSDRAKELASGAAG
jgi:hypothetical protein